jgi:hypothetical protein
MVTTPLKPETCTELAALLAKLAGSIGETMSSLVGRPIDVRPGEARLQDSAEVTQAPPRAKAVVRGKLDDDHGGGRFLTLIELPDALALAGLLMMTPEDVIGERRKRGVLEGEDLAAFGELGNVLLSGFVNVLREKLEGIEISMEAHGTIAADAESAEIVGDGRLVTFAFGLKIGEYPESNGLLAIDPATAEAWNGASLSNDDGGGRSDPADRAGATRSEEDLLAKIPEAPIRGTLAAFVLQPDAMRALRLSCRRVGLELRRHGRGEIPNPAAHRNEIVLIDVPPGHERRFDWCRRIKELSETTRVVVLIHHPSRQRVTQAFLSRADAILGFPCEETQLSQKLGQLMPDGPPPAADG